MKLVKLSCGNKKIERVIMRQTPGGNGRWGDYKFVVDEALREYDFWIVCHVSGLTRSSTARLNPENIIYVSMEPDEKIPNTHQKFLNQFSKIIICDETIKHKNIEKFNVITWWVGLGVEHKNNKHKFQSEYKLDYDKLTNYKFEKKLDRVSVVISKKAITKGHIKRLEFLRKLMKTEAGKYIDIYGGGFNPILDKWDAIEPYKYHLVLENCEKKYYWSEKLGDAYLGLCLPFYAGCKNIEEYFPSKALIRVDMDNSELMSNIILEVIRNNEYKNRLEDILESRNMILNKYNIFNVLKNYMDQMNNISKKELITLYPNYYYTDSTIKKILKRNIFIYNIIKFILNK